MNDCPICFELKYKTYKTHDNEYKKIIHKHNNIIWDNNNFALIPSIGPINFGHLLIVPKRHIFSFYYINKEELEDLEKIKIALIKFNKEKMGKKTEFFEHGSGCNINAGGSCINHAHLHSIPTNISVINEIKNISLDKITNIESIKADGHNGEQGYLYINDIYNRHWINNKDIQVSQIMRMYYSKIFSNATKWDWRQYPQVDTVEEVINNYKGFSL